MRQLPDHFPSGGCDEIDNADLNAAEGIADGGQCKKAVKELGNRKNDQERRQAHGQCGKRRTGHPGNMEADIRRCIHGDGAGRRFRNGCHIEKFVVPDPALFLDELVLQQRDHGIATAERKRADFQKRQKQGKPPAFHVNHLRHQYRALQQKKQEAARLDGLSDFSVMLP